jgi:prepilin-type processing-associated H-X9-DG protein
LTDLRGLINGQIYRYVNNVGVYECPSDKVVGRVRSVSMNCWLNGSLQWNTSCVNFKKISDLSMVSTLVFIEENPATINDGYWAENPADKTQWIDSPAHYHDNGCSISFTDGHAERRKWQDINILDGRDGGGTGFPANPLHGPDLPWVQARCTILAP